MILKRLPILLLLSMTLTACDRNDYVTWHCKVDPSNTNEKPLRIILEGSSMKVADQLYSYCGSLGAESYFDTHCSGNAEQSVISFAPKTGLWKKDGTTLNCMPL
jgi:hypothetical protein